MTKIEQTRKEGGDKGMTTSNPYSSTLVDEVSGIEVPNDKHRLWQEGRQATVHEIRKWIRSHSWPAQKGNLIWVEDLQAFLKKLEK